MSHDHLLARRDVQSPNHSTRGGHPIRALVIHTTAGDWPSDRAWLCNPDVPPEQGGPVSSHYIISPNGEAWQLVDEAEAAWGNGILAAPNMDIPIVAAWVRAHKPPNLDGLPNLESVSIEVSARSGRGWTSAQRAKVISLGVDICRRNGLTAAAVIRHADISGRAKQFCPGLSSESWRALVEEMTGGGTNKFWDQVGDGLKDVIRAYGDEPAGPERYTHDPDRPGQNICSYVAGRQRGYIWWHDSKRATTISYVPLVQPS